MAVVNQLNTQVLVNPGTIFGGEVKTPEVKMDIAQAVHFLIATGEGDPVNTNAKVYATDEGGEVVLVHEEPIQVGAGSHTAITIRARQLCKDEKDRVYLIIDNTDADSIVGTVIVTLTNERFDRG